MNTTTAIDQPLVAVVLEVWGAKLTSYLGAMGMVVLQYDCFLTIKDEVCLLVRTSGHLAHCFFCRCDLFGREISPSQKSFTTLTATCLLLQ